ncbi:hypothetical protein [Methyloradius palustris]|uniref:Uncharacterized protein n=1 Tax=Methyloradius palustris TaxID=2778876 RepID=A0A8D5G629_9PROT|nr:hypothetical protein [Methyloradius palustris]BCM23842.1 hypothetical protein ZMTM_01010 [Methyloradius palustris]
MIFGFKIINSVYSVRKESGATLILLLFIIALAATAYSLKVFDASDLKAERDRKTMLALAEAKTALLGYAASPNLNAICTSSNCPRPGDLPCPDTNNDGVKETTCGNASGTTSQAARLGRLPWKSLGLEDIRDGNGERLWYAVSSRYKENSRFSPLNSDSVGTISLRDSTGNLISTSLVAIVFSAGPPLVRQDGVLQLRDTANENVASNYLDIAFGEDNADFVDGTNNGFIIGPIRSVTGSDMVNDKLLTITQSDMIPVIETRVLAESQNGLLDYYCGLGNVNYSTKSCSGAGGFFPKPASFSDTGCLGNVAIGTGTCGEGTLTHGRISANPTIPWTSTSIFRGTSVGNWFQLNAWRELIHYAVAPACMTGTTNCLGSGGFLTLNNSIVTPVNIKQFILIATGVTLPTQLRTSALDKSAEANYLEGENLFPLDNSYIRTSPLTNAINDRAISLP